MVSSKERNSKQASFFLKTSRANSQTKDSNSKSEVASLSQQRVSRNQRQPSETQDSVGNQGYGKMVLSGQELQHSKSTSNMRQQLVMPQKLQGEGRRSGT